MNELLVALVFLWRVTLANQRPEDNSSSGMKPPVLGWAELVLVELDGPYRIRESKCEGRVVIYKHQALACVQSMKQTS